MPKTMYNRGGEKKRTHEQCNGGKTEVSVEVVICIILHITFTSVYETQPNSCQSSLTYSDSLPQLSEPQHKMNWHKCLWKWNIRLEGSVASAALYGNHVLKSDRPCLKRSIWWSVPIACKSYRRIAQFYPLKHVLLLFSLLTRRTQYGRCRNS